MERMSKLIRRYQEAETTEGPFHHDERLGTLLALEHVCHDAMSPLQRMEHEMTPWVIFGIMPVFALANAGISLNWNELVLAMGQPVPLGVSAGLLLGKPAGILLFSWLSVRFGLADLPQGSNWLQILGIGMLGGIGFTMSLFITNLAFNLPALATEAKVGIFAASLLAGIIGYLLLDRVARHRS